MGRPSEWVNVADVKLRCPICNKPDWCLLHVDGKKVICPRVKSNVTMGGAGFLHKVYDNGICSDKTPRKRRSNRCVNWRKIAKQYFNKGRKNLDKMDALAAELHISTDDLRLKWGVGWDGEAYTIPAKNGFEELIGIMRRFPDNEKVWVSHSRNGLFLPKLKSWDGNVFVCEGWTDAVSLVEMGFRAVARSNCQTGTQYLKALFGQKHAVGQVSIVSDNDFDNVHGNVGLRGAEKLARELKGMSKYIAITTVPDEFKDMREWWQKGHATKEAVICRTKRV